MPSDLDLYDYSLPPELIAQHPLSPRDASRMLVVRRGQDSVAHHLFTDLAALLPRRSVLVFNNTRVLPARLTCTLPGGAPAQALLVRELAPGRWQAMVKHARRLKPGQVLDFAQGRLPARCVERTPDGQWVLDFLQPDSLAQRLE
ncbi:MAG TPA: S-adenosylmethionine:tRNA ribosyltransferase-isomerase, partial [bacterium]|nr:S-adenosylmethionine:tRNA ribosyltransferase-isomerase [bacterium]